MKASIRALAAFALVLPLTTFGAGAGHDHHGMEGHKLELNAGKKWATDDALRQGMSASRTAVAAALPAAHKNTLRAADYDGLGKQLGTQVSYIVQNCKLDPKADAQLHLVLQQMIAGIDTIEGKVPAKNRAQGVVQVADALNVYGKYFEHPGWQPVQLPH